MNDPKEEPPTPPSQDDERDDTELVQGYIDRGEPFPLRTFRIRGVLTTPPSSDPEKR